MHELSIAHEIVKSVTRSMSEYPEAKIASITLSIGEYSGVDPDSLTFAFPIVAEDTPAQGAELILQTVTPALKCNDCGAGPVDTAVMRCPRCGSINVTLSSGRELEIKSIDVILPDEEPSEETAVKEKTAVK